VIEGLFKRKSEFVRTPKYGIEGKKQSWNDNKYVPVKFSWTVIVEIGLAFYCFLGIVASFYFMEIAAIPFQILFTLGYGSVAYLSVQQALEARRIKMARTELAIKPITV
jgi:hypothetical protein